MRALKKAIEAKVEQEHEIRANHLMISNAIVAALNLTPEEMDVLVSKNIRIVGEKYSLSARHVCWSGWLSVFFISGVDVLNGGTGEYQIIRDITPSDVVEDIRKGFELV